MYCVGGPDTTGGPTTTPRAKISQPMWCLCLQGGHLGQLDLVPETLSGTLQHSPRQITNFHRASKTQLRAIAGPSWLPCHCAHSGTNCQRPRMPWWAWRTVVPWEQPRRRGGSAACLGGVPCSCRIQDRKRRTMMGANWRSAYSKDAPRRRLEAIC